MMTPADKQKLLNNEMIAKGVERYRRNYQNTLDKGLLSDSKPGSILLQRTIEMVKNGLLEWIKVTEKGSGYEAQIRPHVVALIENERDAYRVACEGCRTIVNNIGERIPFTRLAGKVGKSLEDEARIEQFRRKDKKEYLVAKTKKIKGIKSSTRVALSIRSRKSVKKLFPTETAVKLGGLLLFIFETSGLIKIENVMERPTKIVKTVSGSKELMEWLGKTEEDLKFRKPYFLPTITKPNDWTDVYSGGYDQEVFAKPLIKAGKHTKDLANENLNEFLTSVNRMQSVAFRVDHNVLETALHFWRNNIALNCLPSISPEEVPAFPEAADKDPELKIRWKREAHKIHSRNRDRQSRKIYLNQTLGLAVKFKEEDFYYPLRADFRGRLYTVPSYLTFQSEDLSRALIKFADSKEVTDPRWLYVHNANVWGKDKITMEQRIAWTKENLPLIRKISQDPIGNLEWTKADKPWQALAAAFELDAYLEAKESGKPFFTHLPIWIDGTNNGLQIFSLLSKDEAGAKATNVYPNETPSDIYGQVADKLIEFLKTEDDDKAKFWLAFGIDRKATKKVVMTVPYGVSPHSARNYVKDWYEEICKEKNIPQITPGIAFVNCAYLSRHILRIIRQTTTGAIEIMNWLKEVANLLSAKNKDIKWTSPSGFVVRQATYQKDTKTIKLSYGKTVANLNIVKDNNKLSSRRQQSGISPNFVHSLDAAILHKTVNDCFDHGIKTIATIHDSFATLAPDLDTMNSLLLKRIEKIFSVNLLEDLRKQLEAHSGIKLSDPPKQGTLDLSLITKSVFFYA